MVSTYLPIGIFSITASGIPLGSRPPGSHNSLNYTSLPLGILRCSCCGVGTCIRRMSWLLHNPAVLPTPNISIVFGQNLVHAGVVVTNWALSIDPNSRRSRWSSSASVAKKVAPLWNSWRCCTSEQEGMRRKLVSTIDGIRNLHLRGDDDDDMVELQVDEKVAAQHCSLARIFEGGENGHALHEGEGFTVSRKPPKVMYAKQGKVDLIFSSNAVRLVKDGT
uniref:FHA domain-containing protein n=1 Tax=Ditylenchus dipsaci TaxID=166011 RepID=A0A915CX21_9BILA